MSGYDGGSASGGTLAKEVGVPPGTPVPVDDSRQLTDYLNGDYVTVHASVRGTGCSSGEFDPFSWRSALDGKEIIDTWIPNQPWSNGAVGILGHSYGGITGVMVAATQPQHLQAVTAVRRQLLRVRAAQRARRQHRAPGTRHAVADHAAHDPAQWHAARPAAVVRRTGSGPLRRTARLTPPEAA